VAGAFSDLIGTLREHEGRIEGVIPDDWMQGRTTFGGLTAALCLEGAQRACPGLPPLRSAQVSFLGPAGGPVGIAVTRLRAGRSVSFVSVDLSGREGLATRALFTFGAARQSVFDRRFVAPPPPVSGPERCTPYFPAVFLPAFTRHFDARLARGALPVSGSGEHEHFAWVRHRDAGATSTAALLALADVPPPAMLAMFREFAPISTMTWIVNLLTSTPSSRDGWWLLRFAADHAGEGYSSQDMTVWNSDGEAVIAGRQCVAIFA
jgi:acyl-CoA thioesterase